MIVQYDDGPYDVLSFSCKATYGVQTSVGVLSNAMLTGTSLFDTGANLKLVNKDYLPAAWRK